MCSREAVSMNATLSKKLRFSDVVYAIGSTPKAVRLWLQRGLVEIHTPKPEGGGWTEYSFRDIAILSLVRSLVNFGVDVPTASKIANTIMGDHFFPQVNHLKNPDEVSVGVLPMVWVNRRLYLYRDGDDWRMELVALWEGAPGREPAPVCISVDVESVIRTAFERANESVNDGVDGDDAE
jgi:hypothetical protein